MGVVSIEQPDEIDKDFEEDEEEEEESNIHTFRKRGQQAIFESLRFIEDGALGVSQRHGGLFFGGSSGTIGGRLGGTMAVSIDDKKEQQQQEQPLEYADEGTGLLPKEQGAKSSSPPLSVWIVPALSCAAAYAFYNIFIKKGSSSINPVLGCVVLQFVAALLGVGLLGSILIFDKNARDQIHYDRKGLMWSCCAGLAVGTAEMLSFCVSGMGVQATQSIPIIIGGSVIFGNILGTILLGETMMLHGWSGVALLVFGIGMVATDPGPKVEEGPIGVHDEEDPPPLVVWIGPALVCAAAYAFYNIFIKKGSASINPILGGVILQFVAAMFGSLLLLAVIVKDGGTSELQVDSTGLAWSICAGVAVGAAEMLSFCVSGMGVNATQSIPIIIGGSILFGSILGILMLGEILMLQGWMGVVLLMVGIGFVATDPGEKVAGH
jgi:transporter family protein